MKIYKKNNLLTINLLIASIFFVSCSVTKVAKDAVANEINGLVHEYVVDGNLLVSDPWLDPSVGYSIKFVLKQEIDLGNRLPIWLGSNSSNTLNRTGIEILFDDKTVQINIKYPDANWRTLPPAALNESLRKNDAVEIRVYENNIVEILANDTLRAKFFLAESLTESFGRLMGNGLGVNLGWQGTNLIDRIAVQQLTNYAPKSYHIKASYPVSETPYFVTGAKLNDDDYIDLVIVNRGAFNFDQRSSNKYTSVLYGKADGSFLPVVNYEVGQGPYMGRVADVNNDGLNDIIVASFFTWTNRSLSVLLGAKKGTQSYNSDGPFITNFIPLPYSTPLKDKRTTAKPWPNPGLSSIIIKDFNRDGNLDLAATGWTNATLYIMLGDGKGNFNFLEKHQSLKYGSGFRKVDSVDIDGDGIYDLAITAYLSNEVSLFKGQGDGTFNFVKTYSSGGLVPYFLNFGDFNHDQKPDIVVGNYSGQVKLLLNTGGFEYTSGGIYKQFCSSWSKFQSSPISDGYYDFSYEIWNDYWNVVRDPQPYDFNGDGKMDLGIVCQGTNSGYFSILYGVEPSTHSGKYFGRSEQYYLGKGPRSIYIKDLDNDDKDEIVIVRQNGNDVYVLDR